MAYLQLFETHPRRPPPARAPSCRYIGNRAARRRVGHRLLTARRDAAPRRVFTHAASNHPSDAGTCREILSAADRRGARVIVARLHCAPDELARRVLSPERRLRMKEMAADAARMNAVAPPFDPGVPDIVDIDTTARTAEQVADIVIEAAERLALG